jgi:hypothetical protein
MWGARGPFPPAAVMVVAVVTPLVFFAKAAEKFVVCKQYLYILLTYIVKNITIHVTLIVRWTELKL